LAAQWPGRPVYIGTAALADLSDLIYYYYYVDRREMDHDLGTARGDNREGKYSAEGAAQLHAASESQYVYCKLLLL